MKEQERLHPELGDELDDNLARSGPSGLALREISHNASVFAHLVDLAMYRARRGRYKSALEWCRLASSFAMTNPTGLLRSVRLEKAVDLVSESVLDPSQAGLSDASGDRRRVLHVLTEAAGIGGLTRLTERWIKRDALSVSTVVVTRQSSVIESLVTVAEATGGSGIALGPDLGDSIERAAALRRLALDADIVICHLHSDDVVAATAFGAGYSGAPVALYNHADHLFWLAPTQATAVIDARDVGYALSIGVRGYATEASFMLPLPVPARAESSKAPEPRKGLGFTDQVVVAVSVARAVKFKDSPLLPTFSNLVSAALDQNPELVFCAVGPAETDTPWPALSARYMGRVTVTGPIANPETYLDIADIYLDTFPFSSTTSLLEAAASSLPTLTLDAHRGLRRALGLADFVVAEEDRPTNVRKYLERLGELVGDPEVRRRSGTVAREGYLALTAEDTWLKRLEGLYERLAQNAIRGASIGATHPPVPNDQTVDYSLALLAVEQKVPVLWSTMGSLPRFDNRDQRGLRVRAVITRVARKGAKVLGKPPWSSDRILFPIARYERNLAVGRLTE